MIITWLTSNILPYLLKALSTGKKNSASVRWTIIIAILGFMLWNQKTMQTNLTSTMKNTDTLKVQLGLHLKDYDNFKTETRVNYVDVKQDLQKLDEKAERSRQDIVSTRENYADQLIKLYRDRWRK